MPSVRISFRAFLIPFLAVIAALLLAIQGE